MDDGREEREYEANVPDLGALAFDLKESSEA